jgi:GC-rich sequence DNA-binding factor
LDGGNNHDEAEGLSDEEPEFRGRITMFWEKKKTESTNMKKTKKGVFEDNDDDERATSVHFEKDSENGESVVKRERERERENDGEGSGKRERREKRECYFSIRIMDGNTTVLPNALGSTIVIPMFPQN